MRWGRGVKERLLADSVAVGILRPAVNSWLR
jgi:hypothetical protein